MAEAWATPAEGGLSAPPGAGTFFLAGTGGGESDFSTAAAGSGATDFLAAARGIGSGLGFLAPAAGKGITTGTTGWTGNNSH